MEFENDSLTYGQWNALRLVFWNEDFFCFLMKMILVVSMQTDYIVAFENNV